MLRGGPRLVLRRCVQCRANRSRQARQQPPPRERPFRPTPPMSQIAVDSSSRCLPAPPEPCCTANHATALIVWIKYDLTRTKTAGYDLFPNVLPVYNARGRPCDGLFPRALPAEFSPGSPTCGREPEMVCSDGLRRRLGERTAICSWSTARARFLQPIVGIVSPP